MPSFLADDTDHPALSVSSYSHYSPSPALNEKHSPLPNGDSNATASYSPDRVLTNGTSVSSQASSLPNGGPVGGPARSPMHSTDTARISNSESTRSQLDGADAPGRLGARDDGYFAAVQNGVAEDGCLTTHVRLEPTPSSPNGDGVPATRTVSATLPSASPSEQRKNSTTATSSHLAPDQSLRVPGSSAHRLSSPPAFGHNPPGSSSTTSTAQAPGLQHRHTLEVPKASGYRSSREAQRNSDDMVVSATGRFSPNTPTKRRGSMSLVRRTTRSMQSDMHLDEVPADEDAARWAEHIRQKRASKRKRKEDDDDDRVVVGTKVDQNHVNWVTAYNMLTGIRFTVSRTNAKMDRPLTDADFEARHKFSFDITGNELTPSAKYDFKFKDYAPWVFRHLRQTFKIDPADYLMSLTSKYILSELGSPGKSGSFFYFSRDYKYIIKTIHHAEHKFLRRILKDYYNHVRENPNTLLSQFYGLHRVKIPYGRKIHFVVMNNLFPPHRDIHRTFDLKGSTIGRDFREEDLEKNPRATLKDLNWLRRNLHLEFGPVKKQAFIEQMERDVQLLKKLKIMDYSLLVGIHDLEKGNEENLRDKTLQVFQPGGDAAEDHMPNPLQRTPSKLENARKAKELRQIIKNQKPIPMDQSSNKMPDDVQETRKHFYFYSDDGGFQATHENNTPGEEIYYLGIIDCLTHYSFVKRMEHFFKGLTNTESQISAIPPERYGDRFVRFISGVTKTRELAEQEKKEKGEVINDPALEGINLQPTKTDEVIEKAEHQAQKSIRHGANEEAVPERAIHPARSPSAERGEAHGSILPVVEEVGESGSVGGRSGRSHDASPRLRPSSELPIRPPPTPPKDSRDEDQRPPTPPKDDGYQPQGSPPTPPKEERGRLKDKSLPIPPPNFASGFTRSPSQMKPVDMEERVARVDARVN
ncbi:Phosphatidylinositol-4-phosphate 5-kinase core [Botryosphaeria dothidea]|uniref:1-phosphatidylinositol-4-phosphate 5-kinase n=1 Tax=Botryosphaeria dothidea TaxID=55169 RepID=A0A8H4N113_9PEZI|nr:Phosphatidylinositol-4-phosphate 5-kinase core [Botryosphaeria dothidea]